MANTVTISALQQQIWSKELMQDVMRDVENAVRFMGTDENNIIQVSRDLAKRKGDQETFGLIARLTGDGVDGDDELEGNEESMETYSDSVAIDQKRNGVRLKGKLDAQKVVYDQIKGAKGALQVWMKEFIVQQIFLKLGGVTNTGLVNTNGDVIAASALWSNTPDYIPDADTAAGSGKRYLCANASGAASLGAGDTMTLDLVTKAATKAKLAFPKIQPLSVGGDDFYVMYLHPLQARDIRTSSDWKTAQEYGQLRGENNPVFRGALGYWSNVLLLENEFAPFLDISVAGNSFRGSAVGTAYAHDAARAVLCGRQACLYAEVNDPQALTVETFDYGNKDGVAASLIGGFAKAMFNSLEFGVVAVDSAVTNS
ncbi:MAG: N4-gp56 family major capsid protein [Patescibacteria group bacterium]|nr:N4-gp56 family major capsid protein [Patescibacteria group bacterium]